MYLWGISFKILTDYKAFELTIKICHLTTTTDVTAKLSSDDPFEILFGVKMNRPEAEIIKEFECSRDNIRSEARKQILKIQNENKSYYNLKRKCATVQVYIKLVMK